MLLNRPNYEPTTMVETINDKDGFISNVWRSLKFSPEKTAEYADWPVNHADLSARKRWLISKEKHLLENLIIDDEWHDPKAAGYWIWAASCWIGSGLTKGNQGNPRPQLSSEQGITICKRPNVADVGRGISVNSLAGNQGVIGKIPKLDGIPGVNAIGQIPYISRGIAVNPNIYDWFASLQQRLRYVQVVCGDWTRVCGGNWQDDRGVCGIFFDPPYSVEDRDTTLYHNDSTTIATDVAKWASERGNKPSYRIVIAGYEEHEWLVKECGWTKVSWKANGGYANQGKNKGDNNSKREALYFSPYCLNNSKQGSLF